jgi:hypothetical protein
MSLLSGACCSATIRAREPTKLLSLDGSLFTGLVVRYPALQDYLFHLLTHRLREANSLKEAHLKKGIKGSLDDLQLAELLQALHMSRKSGLLDVDTPRGKAVVALEDGEIVGIDYLDRRGVEGFFELLRESRGTFSFSPALPGASAGRPPIGDFMALLMQGFVRMDEGQQQG